TKESRCFNTYIRQSRLQGKTGKERQRGAIYNDKRNSPRQHNTYKHVAPNTGAPKYIRQLLTSTKGDINDNTVIVGDLNTPLTSLDRSSRQNVNKETVDLNEKLGQMNLKDIYRESTPLKNSRIYILLKHTWNILKDIAHIGKQGKPEQI
uniref:Endonuclease/exonuclease/phosphatase domain-containing protein n=1 Tax=Equus caballus TaxID=9796 RepID=A0A9L0SAQ5_HORSE